MRNNIKGLIFLLLLTIQSSSFAQQITGKEDSCIVSLKSVRFNKAENGHITVLKDSVPDFIKHIKDCSVMYKYPDYYRDHSFELTVPPFLKYLSYGFGDSNFYYSINDSNNSDSLTTSILIYYDFNDDLRDFYLSQVKRGSEKIAVVKKDGSDWYKTDYDPDKFEGKIFVNNSIILMYYTTDKLKEEVLLNSLLSFSFK